MKTRIDFHSNVGNQLEYTCRLIRKALAAQCKLIVCHQDQAQLAQLDQLLWSFSSTDFLPHVTLNGHGENATQKHRHPLARCTPVLLTLAANNEVATELPHNEILINLSATVPTDFSQFERLIEIVPQQEQSTQAGRERYRFYQQHGYRPNHINAK